MAPTHVEGDDRFGLGSFSTLGADVQVVVWPVRQQSGQKVHQCRIFFVIMVSLVSPLSSLFSLHDFKCIDLLGKFL